MTNERNQVLLFRFGPWVTFALTIVLAAWLGVSSRDLGRVMGYADGEPVAIAPTEAARVLALAVAVGQDVTSGQVVATMDTQATDAELAIAEAKLAELDARIAAETAGGRNDDSSRLSALDESVDHARLALAEAEASFARADAENKGLEAEVQRVRALVRDGLATRADLAAVELKYRSAKQRAEAKPETLEIQRQQLHAAVERRDLYVETVDATVEPLKRQVEVLGRRIAWLKQQTEDAVLRAPTEGRITSVLKRSGETVASGMPVVTMVPSHVDRVVACVAEQHSIAVHSGQAAELSSVGDPGRVVRGRVISLGPSVAELPPRCQRLPAQHAFGRSVVVLLDQKADALPGEAFDVRFLGDTHGTQDGIAVAAVGGENPRTVKVPEELSEHTRFEPSGLVWQPNLLRYVVVSDDTGEPTELEHAPWLFTMTVDGKVDPQPLSVSGVRELNDLESIAVDTDGSVYVLSSQSYSKKGNRPFSRTAFLRLKPSDNGYEVTGELHLAEALEAADPAVRERLGLAGGARELEIEGLDVRGGQVYFGLKSPLDADGRAGIWRLSNPRAAFDRGTIDFADLELWARVSLVVEADGREVPGGISDMLFLPDGKLLLATTPASGDAAEESGRVVYVSDPHPGVLEAHAYRSFTGLRPEGLSVAPAPGRFAVVFDTGDAVSKWIELPWPG